MRRKEIDVHHRAVGEVGNLAEARDRRDRRSPTDIDEDAIGAELHPVHCHFLVGGEAGMAFVNRAAFQRFERTLDAPPRCPRDSVLPRLDGLGMSTPTGPPMVTP